MFGFATGVALGMAARSAFSPYVVGFVPQNPHAWMLFQHVDRNRSGSVDFRELQSAMSHGGWYTALSNHS
jgi:hypothetical protein